MRRPTAAQWNWSTRISWDQTLAICRPIGVVSLWTARLLSTVSVRKSCKKNRNLQFLFPTVLWQLILEAIVNTAYRTLSDDDQRSTYETWPSLRWILQMVSYVSCLATMIHHKGGVLDLQLLILSLVLEPRIHCILRHLDSAFETQVQSSCVTLDIFWSWAWFWN